MTRYTVPEIRCDHDSDCDTTTPDFYEQAASSVNGVNVTISKRAPGWFSTINADYCPEHLPWLVGTEKNDE